MKIDDERRRLLLSKEQGDSAGKLVDVKEHWLQAQEVPLAHTNSENIITEASLWEWMRAVRELGRRGLLPNEILEKHEPPILFRELLEEYHRLRFLSKNMATIALSRIAQDIQNNFSPQHALIILEKGSSQWFYQNFLAALIPEFDTIRWDNFSQGPVFHRKANFIGDNPYLAKSLLYIDDWILSGTQLNDQIFPFISAVEQLFTYHLVVSDRGHSLYQKNGLQGKTAFRIIGDEGPNSFFGTYPLYGFHKIPDLISKIFTASAKNSEPNYSIFPEIEGGKVGAHSRLVAY